MHWFFAEQPKTTEVVALLDRLLLASAADQREALGTENQPLITAIGTSFATFLAMPAASITSTTSATSL